MEKKIMKNSEYMLISGEDEIKKFIESNENTKEILEAIKPQLKKHFPNPNYPWKSATD